MEKKSGDKPTVWMTVPDAVRNALLPAVGKIRRGEALDRAPRPAETVVAALMDEAEREARAKYAAEKITHPRRKRHLLGIYLLIVHAAKARLENIEDDLKKMIRRRWAKWGETDVPIEGSVASYGIVPRIELKLNATEALERLPLTVQQEVALLVVDWHMIAGMLEPKRHIVEDALRGAILNVVIVPERVLRVANEGGIPPELLRSLLSASVSVAVQPPKDKSTFLASVENVVSARMSLAVRRARSILRSAKWPRVA